MVWNLTFKTKYNTTLNKPLQRWLIGPDATYGRWKIALASDQNKFSDEVGRMNKNIYYSDWNSMALYECNGNWAIEGVTRDAAKFWGVTEETTPKIQRTDKSLQDSYIFQIVEDKGLADSVPAAVSGSPSCIWTYRVTSVASLYQQVWANVSSSAEAVAAKHSTAARTIRKTLRFIR